jgi:hypothetical protein
MTTRTWAGGTGLWSDPGQWIGGVAPLPDDTALVNAGAASFFAGETLDAATIELGSSSAAAPATLLLADALIGHFATIDSAAPGDQAELAVAGAGFLDGTIDATASGGAFTLNAFAYNSAPGNLTLLDGASLNDSGGDTMSLSGTLTSQAEVTVGSGGNFVNNGTIAQSSAAFDVASGGTLGGAGLFEIGLYSSLYFDAGSAPSSQDVRFTDVGGRLLLTAPGDFTGVIGNFATGDLIDLTSIVASAASFDPASGLLSVTDNGGVVATLTLDAPEGSTFVTTGDGSTGTLVELAGTETRVDYTIDGPDRAIGANVVRATLTTPGGTPITGAGVRVGIISTSFDEAPGVGAADVANAAAQAGFLPETGNGASAVTVLSDALNSGDDNEGLAMAELVHQVAPGASIDFATGDGGLAAFANAETALQDAGCNVIVDDLGYDEEPFFQNAGPLDAAIESAIGSGVSYFAAAGNQAAAAYQAAFEPNFVTLYDGTSAPAQMFGNGTPYQSVTLHAGVAATFDIQWAAPYLDGNGGTVDLLQAKLFDMSGNLVATSTPDVNPNTGAPLGGGLSAEPGIELSFTPSATARYQLAIYGGLLPGTVFKYILLGSFDGGSTLAGTIDDPAANAGTIKGHAMLPGVNSVGAIDFAETPGFGVGNGQPDYYSAAGDAEFLFDANGTALPSPQIVAKPDLLAPVEAATSVTGFAPFRGTSAAAPEAAAVAALMLQADPALTPAQIQTMLAESATGIGQPGSVQGSGIVNAVAAVQLALAAAPCFAAGTRIATARGLVAVESLRVGDRVVTESGALRAVVWLGHRRVECRRHPRPRDVLPVRVRAHAFAPQRPARDLNLSPDHAVKVSGALIPVRHLVNGASIAQIAVAAVTYWHVELPSHDVLLAEGLPAESFLDTGNRAAFANGGGVVALHPDFSRRVWAERGCAPLLTEGPALAEAHARLLARATQLGHRLGRDPGLRLYAAGRKLIPRIEGRRYTARLPAGADRVRLLSRAWVPAHLGAPDGRTLGVAIAGLTLDGSPVDLADTRLCAGWHNTERDWRWTDGAATLRTGGARELAFELAMAGKYWGQTGQQARGAAPRPSWGRRPQTP